MQGWLQSPAIGRNWRKCCEGVSRSLKSLEEPVGGNHLATEEAAGGSSGKSEARATGNCRAGAPLHSGGRFSHTAPLLMGKADRVPNEH